MKSDLLYQDRVILSSLFRQSRTLSEVYDYASKRCGIDLFDVEQRLKSMSGIYVDCIGGKYSLTANGKSVLLYDRQYIRRSIVIPILVSLLTNLAIYGTQRLLPLIQQWVSSNP